MSGGMMMLIEWADDWLFVQTFELKHFEVMRISCCFFGRVRWNTDAVVIDGCGLNMRDESGLEWIGTPL